MSSRPFSWAGQHAGRAKSSPAGPTAGLAPAVWLACILCVLCMTLLGPVGQLRASASTLTDALDAAVQEYWQNYGGGAPVTAVVGQAGQIDRVITLTGTPDTELPAKEQQGLLIESAASAAQDGLISSGSAEADGAVGSFASQNADNQADDGLQAESQGTSSPDVDGAGSSADDSASMVSGANTGTGGAAAIASQPLDTSAVVDWGRSSDILIWISVMQLVEQGELNLSSSIRTLLPEGVALPEGSEPITMLNLMNHTTGYNVSMMGSAGASVQGFSVTETIGLYEATPVYTPGSFVSYSSYDAALAAAVVESISGTTIVDYITTHILEPLGMDSTAVAAGLGAARMRSSEDARMSRVASNLVNTKSAVAAGVSLTDAIASLTSNLTDASVLASLDGAALTCLGSLDDMALLVQELSRLCSADASSVLMEAATLDTMMQTSRSFPALLGRRIAHGLFALPTLPSAVGMTSSAQGHTCAVYLDPDNSSFVLLIINRPSRTGLAQGLAGALLRVYQQADTGSVAVSGAAADSTFAASSALDSAEGIVSTASAGSTAGASGAASSSGSSSSSRAGVVNWTGVYQDVSLPTSGPAKLFSFFERTWVVHDPATGSMQINGIEATELGMGVYVTPEPSGNDPYRFHVGITHALEFSRTMGDSYVIPGVQQLLETALIALPVLAIGFCTVYACMGVAGFVGVGLHRRGHAHRQDLAHHPRHSRRGRQEAWDGQPSVLLLALPTAAAGWWTCVPLLSGGTVFLSAVPMLQLFNPMYCAYALVLILWILITRWRGTGRTGHKLAGAVMVCLSALVLMLGFLYWELLL